SLYENPSSATAAVTKFLPDVKTDAVAQRFISDKLWYANGGLTGPGLENTLQAFSLPGDRASLVDDTALKAALQEIGPSSQTKY
ncbi:MAG TPA: hypothetical protein VFW86_04010, partial [Candidatus Limnocylindrales bacterium]|nr:hypothetical protein [Candidatus Limnocylindrales bacterium]